MTRAQNIQKQLTKLRKFSEEFSTCFNLFQKEEINDHRSTVMDGWHSVLKGNISKVHELLSLLRENNIWSLADDGRNDFIAISSILSTSLKYYAEYDDEDSKMTIQSIIMMIEEGKTWFQRSQNNEAFYHDLFSKTLECYQRENEERLEMIYRQDDQDLSLRQPDENDRKIFLVSKRREELFATQYGKIYHDLGRRIDVLISYIFNQKEREYTNINIFFDKYLALQIAENHLEIKEESVFINSIFKENVDVDKVIRKLGDFLEDKTISAQKHWFIVHKVFSTKKWLATKSQEKFRDQIMAVFSNRLKCSKEDFKKVDTYFKDKDYKNWTMHDPTAPPCCDEYRKIALVLDTEFQDVKYAKPGKCITTKNPEKFR